MIAHTPNHCSRRPNTPRNVGASTLTRTVRRGVVRISSATTTNKNMRHCLAHARHRAPRASRRNPRSTTAEDSPRVSSTYNASWTRHRSFSNCPLTCELSKRKSRSRTSVKLAKLFADRLISSTCSRRPTAAPHYRPASFVKAIQQPWLFEPQSLTAKRPNGGFGRKSEQLAAAEQAKHRLHPNARRADCSDKLTGCSPSATIPC